MTPSDSDLLQRFTRDHAQDAFTELVQRHVNLVYSAALRQVRSPQLAEEISQSVFTDLARHATNILPANETNSLAPWLYAVTRRTAVDVIRKESRRQLREQIAVEMNAMNTTEAAWPEIEPLLDDAMAALDETDRTAVLLRYFENKSLREVGAQLGMSDDTAQKRVSRAVEKLREFFSKRKITIGTSGLAIAISANAVQAAPVGLAVTISAAALTGTVATTSTLIAATTKTIAMTTLQKTLVTATVVVLAGAGIYQARQAHDAQNETTRLQAQQTLMLEQIQKLKNDLSTASNTIAGLKEDFAKNQKDNSELLKLRGKVTQLQEAANVQNDPAFQKASEWLTKETKLRQLFEQHPNQSIPEMKYLSKEEWLDKARMADLDTTFGIRLAMSNVRTAAKYKFASLYFNSALSRYLITHNQQLPVSPSELSTYFPPSINDAETILARYEMINRDAQTNPAYEGFAIIEKPVLDNIDAQLLIGDKKMSVVPKPTWPSGPMPEVLMPVVNAYSDANNGEGAANPLDIVPYATTSEQKEALNKILNSATVPH